MSSKRNHSIIVEVFIMPDYQKLYTTMFNAATDALEELGHLNIGRAREILRATQQKTEALYVGEDDGMDEAGEDAAGEAPAAENAAGV